MTYDVRFILSANGIGQMYDGDSKEYSLVIAIASKAWKDNVRLRLKSRFQLVVAEAMQCLFTFTGI